MSDILLLQLQNESSLPIKFWMRLESLSKKRAENRQQLPKFLTSHEQRTEIVGELTHCQESQGYGTMRRYVLMEYSKTDHEETEQKGMQKGMSSVEQDW